MWSIGLEQAAEVELHFLNQYPPCRIIESCACMKSSGTGRALHALRDSGSCEFELFGKPVQGLQVHLGAKTGGFGTTTPHLKNRPQLWNRAWGRTFPWPVLPFPEHRARFSNHAPQAQRHLPRVLGGRGASAGCGRRVAYPTRPSTGPDADKLLVFL